MNFHKEIRLYRQSSRQRHQFKRTTHLRWIECRQRKNGGGHLSHNLILGECVNKPLMHGPMPPTNKQFSYCIVNAMNEWMCRMCISSVLQMILLPRIKWWWSLSVVSCQSLSVMNLLITEMIFIWINFECTSVRRLNRWISYAVFCVSRDAYEDHKRAEPKAI